MYSSEYTISSSGKFTSVLLDNYSLSTNDATHKKRSGKASETIEMKEMSVCVADRNTFLSNYEKKKTFVKGLT